MDKNHACFECKKEFLPQKYQRGGLRPNSARAYCSATCRGRTYSRENRKKNFIPIQPRDCLGCGSKFTPVRFKNQVSCSSLCNAEIQKKKHREQNALIRPGKLICERVKCGIEFSPCQKTQKFCSRKCYVLESRRRWVSKNRNVLRERQRLYRLKNPDKRRELAKQSKWGGSWLAAIERDSWTCKKCGNSDRSVLLVHHLDGEGETAGKNHTLENLQTLCRSCHRIEHKGTVLLRVNGKLFVRVGKKLLEVRETT